MDSIKVAKVEDVLCRQSAKTASGTLHLTAHHLIFCYDDTASEEEMWVPYPLISLVTRAPQTLQGQSPLNFSCRNFRTFVLLFKQDSDSLAVFESVKELTVAVSVSQLYAFFYIPNPLLTSSNGWSIYSPKEEFARMGVGSRTKAWRFSGVNKDYTFCRTYPSQLVVPTRISDSTLQYASRYRTKCRIPTLAYLHWANFGTITRSSQPMVGLTNNRSIQDEKLIEAIFQSHHGPDSKAGGAAVFGATATNLIIDARPTTNAMANVAKGAGTENMDHYKEGKKAYLGVDNIHVMRDSLAKVVEALREADSLAGSIGVALDGTNGQLGSLLDRYALRRSGWLRHISAILDGTVLIVKNVHINSSHVLIHCSDGWDRTAQLSSLAQLCLDPYYRTIKGFQILVEKDWLSFGHKFLDRCGHLSSDKFFLTVPEAPGSGAEAAQAFLASVQNRIAGQQHLKETSPVFHQFLECVRQIQRQFPQRFQFNSLFLEKLFYHLYSCQFGTFLYNCERERRVGDGGPPPCIRTVSVWDFLNSSPEADTFINKDFDPSLNDPARRDANADMGVLLPDPKDVRLWHEIYGRTDEEMNGRIVVAKVPEPEFVGPTDGKDDPVNTLISQAASVPLPVSPSPSPSPAVLPISRDTTPTRIQPALPPSGSSPSARPDRSATGRPDSFRPFETMTSTYSLQNPLTGSPSAARSGATSPSRGRQNALDLFGANAGSGVRSMWGKLSSNASAAFTVVQGAYDDVTKDLKGISLPANNSSANVNRELTSLGSQTQDDGDPWGSRPVPSSSPGSRISQNTIPWQRSANQRIPSITMDNPWGTAHTTKQSSTSRPTPQRLEDIFTSPSNWSDQSSTRASSLPSDPTVSDEAFLGHVMNNPSASSELGQSSPGSISRSLNIPSSSTEQTGSKAEEKNTDPLGVGVW